MYAALNIFLLKQTLLFACSDVCLWTVPSLLGSSSWHLVWSCFLFGTKQQIVNWKRSKSICTHFIVLLKLIIGSLLKRRVLYVSAIILVSLFWHKLFRLVKNIDMASPQTPEVWTCVIQAKIVCVSNNVCIKIQTCKSNVKYIKKNV